MAKPKTPTAAYRDKRLADTRMQINEMRSSLLELAMEMNQHVHPLDETAWPNANDPDDHVMAMKRLKLLAEIVHAIGFAIDNITEIDVKPATAYARLCVLKFGGKTAKGWDKPLGRARTAPAKDALLERVRAARAQAAKKNTEPVDEMAAAFFHWLSWDCGTDAGARELLKDLPVNRYSKDLKKTLTDALARIPNVSTIGEDKVIQAVWAELGARPDVVHGLFSYLDQRAKRKKPQKQED